MKGKMVSTFPTGILTSVVVPLLSFGYIRSQLNLSATPCPDEIKEKEGDAGSDTRLIKGKYSRKGDFHA